jgi:hypothetical protein
MRHLAAVLNVGAARVCAGNARQGGLVRRRISDNAFDIRELALDKQASAS